jgi:hypothetical protein
VYWGCGVVEDSLCVVTIFTVLFSSRHYTMFVVFSPLWSFYFIVSCSCRVLLFSICLFLPTIGICRFDFVGCNKCFLEKVLASCNFKLFKCNEAWHREI